jgi:hypothetical protein
MLTIAFGLGGTLSMKHKIVYIFNGLYEEITLDLHSAIDVVSNNSFCSEKAAEKAFLKMFDESIQHANSRILSGQYVIIQE